MFKKGMTGKTLFVLISFFLITLLPVCASADGIEYSTHVQNIGWQNYVKNGETAGTTGKALRLEGLKIRLINPKDMGVEYRTHVQDIGWQEYVKDDQLAGTEHQAKRLEAVSIRLTGNDAKSANVYYRVHAEDHGWLGWAKNGEDAGTAHQAKRLEAIEIVIKPASEAGPTSDKPAFIDGSTSAAPQPQGNNPDPNTPLHFRTYIAGKGWSSWAKNGEEMGSGPTGAIEAIQFGMSEPNYAYGDIVYKKMGNGGWTNWLKNDQVNGAPGDPVQAVRIKFTRSMGFLHDIYYRVHIPGVGWTVWAKNGEPCGTEGYSKPISMIQAIITERGQQPGPTGPEAFNQGSWTWPLDNYHSLSTYFGPRGEGSHHDGIDIPAPEGTPIKSAKTGTVIYTGYADGFMHTTLYGAFGNCVAVEHDSGEVVYYGHLSRFGCSTGQRVAAGQVIGYVGTTGNSLGNHLHMEVYDARGELVDPLGFYK